jgi:hypothetical protein
MNACLFCQDPNATVTVEDTLSKPIGDLLKTGRVSFFHWDVDDLGVHRRVPYEGDRVTYKRRAYCAKCNGGWMQQMDLDIVPLIAPMVAGMRTSLSPSDQLRVASWATKIGLVYESLSGTGRVVPDHVYKWFFDNRIPLRDRPIQLARYVDSEPHLHMRKEFAWRDGSTLKIVDYEAVVMAVIIGQYVAITVMPVRPRLLSKLPEGPSRVTIWPIRSEDVIWPPANHFDANTLPHVVEYASRP